MPAFSPALFRFSSASLTSCFQLLTRLAVRAAAFPLAKFLAESAKPLPDLATEYLIKEKKGENI
jgi:hypothetical protein